MKMEKSRSNKNYKDSEFDDWRDEIRSKHSKDNSRIHKKRSQIDLKAKVLQEGIYFTIF